ncbi:MAG: phosphotransferase family protein [Acidimicrobiia bacterium]
MSDAPATPPAGVDLDALARWAAGALPQLTPPFAGHTLVGGQSNITVRIDDAAGQSVVLRRPPLHGVLASAHDMGREHRIISALQDTPVPVPVTMAMCHDVDVIGAPFYVMSYVEGVVLEVADDVEASMALDGRGATAESLVDTLVALHAVDIDAVGLGDFAKREDLIARQLKRWLGQFQAGDTSLVPEIAATVERVHGVLAARVPPQQGATIVHGDFRLGNTIVDPVAGAVRAVLDWEICTLGDPLADVGYLLATWGQADDPVRTQRFAPSTAPGFPRREDLVERYAAGSGRDLSQVEYYMTFSWWRLCCILTGVLTRMMSGARGEVAPDVLDEFRDRVNGCATLADEHAALL